MNRHCVLGLLIVGCSLSLGAQPLASTGPAVEPPQPLRFTEVWSYLLAGEEALFNTKAPLTDLAYFGAGLSSHGELNNLPSIAKIKAFPGRKHLVLAVLDNQALTHMAVYPGFPIRARLIDELIEAAAPYDGLQLDFESIAARDKEHFWSFLSHLKTRLGGKILSVAIPARTRVVDDAYSYATLNTLVDRIIIMAYDEHWSGSKPGPVASLDWGRRVAEYAKTKIEPAKLVMGAPFYGRAWAEKSLSRAYKFSGITQLLDDKELPTPERKDGIPAFEYDETVKVRVYYDDLASHTTRLAQYAAQGVLHIAFWRLGQEDPGIWEVLRDPGR